GRPLPDLPQPSQDLPRVHDRRVRVRRGLDLREGLRDPRADLGVRRGRPAPASPQARAGDDLDQRRRARPPLAEVTAMANRANHYEAAFEAYVRSLRVPCVAVDEAKRALFGEEGVKNPDFLLYPRWSPNLVVEVKGKRGKDARGRRPWENWVTTDDLDGLVRWQAMFGPGFRSILAFVYAEPPQPFPLPSGDSAFAFRHLVY